MSRFCIILTGILSLAICSILPAHEMYLAQNGKSPFRIVLEAQASETEQFAAEELQKYFQQITGKKLPIQKGKYPESIVIRAVERPDMPRVPIPPNEDSFTITIQEKEVEIAGQTPRAALFGVYTLLEKMGCRWFAPNYSFYKEIGNELVPKRASVAFEPQVITSSPSFLYRKKYVEEGHSHNTENLKQLVDWMAKAKMNVFNCPVDYGHSGRVVWDKWRDALTPELKKRGILIEVGGHGYQNYLRQDDYFEKHPDWFGMADGKRVANRNMVFNTSNPEAMAKFAEEVINYLRAHPEIRIFDLWPPDGARWSDDPESNAQGAPEIRHALVVRYVNQAIKEAKLPVMLEAIAYSSYLNYPKGVELPSDIMIDICPIRRSYEFNADDTTCEANKLYHDASLDWKRNFKGNFNLYSYYRRYAWMSKPVVLVKRLPYELKYYHNLGMEGVGSYSEPDDWFTYEYQHYLLAKNTWNVNQNGDDLLQDYCTHRYGAAGKTVARYFITMEPVVTECPTLPVTKPKTKEKLLELQKGAAEARKLLEKAKTELKNDPAKLAAVNRLEVCLKYTEGDLEISLMELEKDGIRLAARKAEMNRFLQENGSNGTILLHGRIARAYGPAAE